MSSTREQIIETTCELLETQGYHATGLNQIVKQSKTPKGSLYYYFPEGKEELAIAAIRLIGERISEQTRTMLASASDPGEALFQFMMMLASHVEHSGFCSGSPLTTVALETVSSNPGLNLACREAYQRIEDAFAQKLREGGFAEERASHLATFINSSIEGAMLLSRTQHSATPLSVAAEHLREVVQTARKD